MTLGLVDKTIATRWEYDTATGQYVDQSGRLVVSASDLRDMVDSLVEGVRK